ncbi:hypothetical protein [Microbacterium sp.]|uniref:hypothetical protein n=1 Tax=Microbacterium sp. TaxID=51671 RepID=UPI003F72E8EA
MPGEVKPILSIYEKAAQDANREIGRVVLKRARELSPTESGASDKSGFTATDDLTTQVGFTSLVSKIQHENLDYQHPNGGQAKFLETAAAEVDVASIQARHLKGALGG